MRALLAGLVAGWAVAVPIGPVGAYLVTLSVTRPWRTGAAAALGVATTDGAYALLAAAGGAALADRVAAVQGPVRAVAAVVLVLVAFRLALSAVPARRGTTPQVTVPAPQAALGAYLLLVALTAVNPATVVSFAALVAGNPEGVTASPGQAAVFVTGVTAASAAWQLLLVTGAGLLGRRVTGRTGRRATAALGCALLLALAVRTVA